MCGVPLRLFYKDFIESFALDIDYQRQKNFETSFEDNKKAAIVTLKNLIKSKSVNLIPIWKEKESTPFEIQIGPGNKTYYDICEPNYDKNTQLLNTKITDTKEYTFSICSMDQFRNPKISKHLSDEELVKIEYPYLVPPISGIKIEANENQNKFKISVPLTGYGDYTIYNENFFDEPKRFFRISVLGVDLDKSYGEINDYIINKISQVNKPIVLYIKVKDAFGSDITIDQLNLLNCSLEHSQIQHKFKSETRLYDFVFSEGVIPVVDGYAAVTFDPQQPGEYTFLPRIKCGKATESVNIKCDFCTFFISSTVPDTTRFKIFSDFKNKDFISNEVNPLYISLDESKNKLLTTLKIIDTSGVEIRQPNIDVRNIVVRITLDDKIVVPIDLKFTPSGIDLNINSQGDRTELFSPLETYYLNFEFSDPNFKANETFKIPVKFSFRDLFLNNINKSSNEIVPENFLLTFIPGVFTIRAAQNRLLFKLVARNSKNELVLGTDLDASKFSVTAVDYAGNIFDLKTVSYKSGYFLYISGSPTKSGTYHLQVKYESKVIHHMDLTVTPRSEIYELYYDSANPSIKSIDKTVITLKDASVDENPVFIMQMVDKFKNVINHDFMQIYNQITLRHSDDVIIQPRVDGTLVVSFSANNVGIRTATLELTNGVEYQIISSKTSLKIDPANSISKFTMIIDTVGNPIKVAVNLYDSFGSNISLNINSNQDSLKDFKTNTVAYILGPSGSIHQLSIDSFQEDTGFILISKEGEIPKLAGEYKLKVYYNLVSLKCQVCVMELKADIVDLTKTLGYIIGEENPSQVPSDNYNILTNQNFPSFYLIFNDKYGNEVTYDANNQLTLQSEQSSESTSNVRLCKINQELKIRNYYQPCSDDDVKTYIELPSGNYFVKVDEIYFKFHINNSTIESSENEIKISPKYSYILNKDRQVSGNVDIPARLIIDFRSDNNLRYDNIDVSKITITASDIGITKISTNFLYGPIRGLITVLISSTEVGIGKLSVSYDGQVIISNISYTNLPGEVNQIEFRETTFEYSDGKYFFFQISDKSSNNCNPQINENIYKNLIEVSNSQGKIPNEIEYNPITCTLSVRIDKKFHGEIKFDSLFLKSSARFTTLGTKICKTNSFAYFEDDSNTTVNSTSVLTVQTYDKNSNPLTFEQIKQEANKFKMLVISKTKDDLSYVMTEQAQLDEESKTINFTHTFKNSGDFIFMPLYNEQPISCTLCSRKVKNGEIHLENTILHIKKGSSWDQKTRDMSYILFQNNLPFFKIIFKDEYGTQVDQFSKDDYFFLLSVDDDSAESNYLDIEVYQTNKNGVFIYLNEIGRSKFAAINPIKNLKLFIVKKSDKNSFIEFKNFVVLNSDKNTVSDTKCEQDSVPFFFETYEFSGFFQAGDDLIKEFYIEGCQSQEDSFYSESDFTIEKFNENIGINKKIIPSEFPGNYLLILTSNKSLDTPIELKLKFKSSKESEKLVVKVLPNSEIAKFVLSSAGTFNSSFKNAYLSVDPYDQYDNLITIDQISFLSSDFGLNIEDPNNNKVLYKYTFNESQNKFLIVVSITSQGNYTVRSKYSIESFILKIENSNTLKNSLISISNFNINEKQFEVKFHLRDEFYKSYTNSELSLINDINFVYYTYNPVTDEEVEVAVLDIKYKESAKDSNVLLLTLPQNIPIFKYSVLIPKHGTNQLICESCLTINEDLKSLYALRIDDSIISVEESYTIFPWEKVIFMHITPETSPATFKSGYQISTISYGDSNSKVQFYGFDSLEKIKQNSQNDQDILVYGNKYELKIFTDSNSSLSIDDVDPIKSIIHAPTVLNLKVGSPAYFYLETRDSSNQLTNKLPKISFKNAELKFNLIKSTFAGFYLIEVYTKSKTDLNTLEIYLNDQSTSSNILFVTKSGFPVSLKLDNAWIIDSTTVSYRVIAQDSYQNIVCDERLNLSAISRNLPARHLFAFNKSENKCYFYFSVSGIAELNSPLLDKFDPKRFIENTASYYFPSIDSSLLLDQNNSRKNNRINFDYLLISQEGFNYPNKPIELHLSIKIYRSLSYNSKTLVKEINSVNKLDSFNLENLNISYGDYLIYGAFDGIFLRNFSPFRYYKSFVENLTNLQIKVKQGNEWDIINNLVDPKSINYSQITLSYPFSFILSLVNQDIQIINIPEGAKIVANLVSDTGEDSLKSIFELEGMPNSETTFLFEIPKNRISDYIHLPRGDYIFVFTVTLMDSKTISKWVPIEIKQGFLQNNSLNVPYSLPNEVLSSNLDIVSSNNSDTINANVGNYTKTILCLKSNNNIYNEYLETDKFVINNLDKNDCSVVSSTYLRGCIDFYIFCNRVSSTDDRYKISFSYKNVEIKTSFDILIDPQLPPKKVKLIEPFKNLIEQKSEIILHFNLEDDKGNNFKYVTQDNFEVFVNDKILEKEKWIVWFNKNLLLKILNIEYPPKKQNIQIYFKDMYGVYTSLAELNSDITVTQGNFDPRKAIISLPVSYFAGDGLNFAIVLRDNFDNCFEDDVNLQDIKVVGNLLNSEFSNFKLTQKFIDFPFCKRIISASVDQSPFTKAGLNKFELYNNNKSLYETNLAISPNKLSPEKSELSVIGSGIVSVAQVRAGLKLEINMKGTDAYSNKVSYYDLAQKLDIDIQGLKKNTDYLFYAKTNEKDDSISMNLIVYEIGRYSLTYSIDNEIFKNKNGLTDLIVTAGECSNEYPKYKLQSDILYTGDYGVIEINCLDDFQNPISVKGDENFKIEIRGNNLEVVGEDKVPYELLFNSGVYISKFFLAYKGQYHGQIYLNGNLYGEEFTINVQSRKCPVDTPVMCSNRKCVKNIFDCTEDIDSYNCQSQDKPFLCIVKGENACVSKLSDCDCSTGFVKCNGMCIPKDMNDICSKPIITNCQRKLPFFKYTQSCPDGSCRTNSRCPNPLGCPIGYKPCGTKCIPRGTRCLIEAPKCESFQVLCWDLSCADSYESCPTGKTCNDPDAFVCPDGKCVNDVTQCTQPPQCSNPFDFLCPDFTCKKSAKECNQRFFCNLGESLCENNKCSHDCSKITKCSSDKYLCSNGQCVENILLCPTDLSCPEGTIKCPTGSCASNINECFFTSFPSLATLKTCPLTLPVLCPDLSCAKNASDCKSLLLCPSDKPYRCPNNECRRNRENCPSITRCPAEFPVLCSDGSCQKASYHCSEKTSKICDGFKCWNGDCVSSISLCPNDVTCPSNLIKCWDGACVSDIKECRDPKYIECPSERPYRCADGSCRIDQQSCSTVRICPSEKPVRCYDNSCKEHINLCPPIQSCGKNMKSCPDGTCTSDKCNTIVTCPQTLPFLCYDNTCVADIRDCPTQPICDGVFCPDGTCVRNRLLCKFFESCPPNNPVKCQHGSCAATVEDCYSILRECPIGFIKCKSGGCKINESLCEDFKCPKHLPYLCPEGVCSLNKNYCDSQTTGCPYNKQFKCIDGTCVKNVNECIKYSKATCPKNSVLCPDGSCRLNYGECPLINGCPGDKPLKCADGICVDPSRSSCSIPKCPFNLPIMCASGECVATSANCPISIKDQDYKDCKDMGYDDHYMCADGRCVPTPDLCRPLSKCPEGYTKCSDGTCKLLSNQCQTSSNCPSNRPARCPFGKCVSKESECFSTIFCPTNFPILCEYNKECVLDASQCPKTPIKANGCPQNSPFKCLDGRCMKSELECRSVNVACNQDFPILCPDGTCSEKRETCFGVRDKCPENYVKCPDETCVEEKYYNVSCKNKIGCPLVKPIRCSDGSCAANESECKSTISCPLDLPVLCADLSCAADAKFCNVNYPCRDNYKRCKNGMCVRYENECEALIDLCPLTFPVKCPTGRCAKTISECSLEFKFENCKEKGQFFCARTSQCVSNVVECVGSYNAAGTKQGSTRLLQKVKQENKITPENQCFSDAPYSCYDGTCRKSREECPIIPACGIMEYRCSNGSCQKDPLKCREQSVVCEPGLNKCEDGLCRKECPPYNGCGLAAPFQCTNGLCVNNHLECIGLSMCENFSNPYRCIDGSCVSDPSKCPDIKRLNGILKQTVSVSSLSNIDINFAYDRYYRNIGRLYIPANSLRTFSINPTNYTTISFEEIPHSLLYQSFVNYNNTDSLLYDYSNGIIGSDGVLDFENSVYSTIVKISGNKINENFTYPGLIYLDNTYLSKGQFKTSDYCLAKLVDNEWICVERKTSDEQKEFRIYSFGIYSVVLNPVRHFKVLDETLGVKNFFFENLKIIVIVLGSLFFAFVVIFYIFTRVIRYRTKYMEHKEKLVNMRNQLEEYKGMSTDVPGQTLGDTIAGIVFTKNSAYSVTNSKGTVNEAENEVEELHRKCRLLETQNKSIEEKIVDINEDYKTLKSEIEKIKRIKRQDL